ncbi:MAG: DUF3857 domain-containing protein [Bacteroidales bacterium]|nr:DUF3857 domain-containing protein [Candidatus Liminaster caballi]
MKAFWIASFCLLLASTRVFAFEKNIKLGNPTNEELSLVSYDEDPDAEAICLYHGTTVDFRLTDQGLKAEYHYKIRIKVLKPEGVDWGNAEIIYYNSSKSTNKETVTGVKGTSYNLENGKVVKSKLNSDLKSDEMLNNHNHVYKFSLPNVKVGSVIEYEYRIESDFFHLIRDWYAQMSIPVRYAEFVITVPEFLKFSKLMTGVYPMEHKFTSSKYPVTTSNGQVLLNADIEEYWAENLPKMVKEDYIHSINDYKSHIIYDLEMLCFPGSRVQNFNNSWTNVDKMLLEDDKFGDLFKMKNPMPEFGVFLSIDEINDKKTEKAGEITLIDLSACGNTKEKVEVLRRAMRKKIKWNGKYGIYGMNTRQMLKESSVNAAALNFALMAILRDAGIQAVPVVLSRRSQGRISSAHAEIGALNAMVLQVRDGDQTFYVDAANDDFPVGTLHPDLLVEYARVVAPNRFEWVDISKCCKANVMQFVNATLDEDGNLNGMLMRRHRGILCGVSRNNYNNKKDSLTHVEKLAANLDCEITDYRVGDFASSAETYTDSIFFTKQVDADGESIYINPYLFVDMKSPFKTATRELPIECDCMVGEKHSIKIQIPEGYVAESCPKPISLRLEDGKTSCKIVTQVTPEEINVSISYNRDTMFYDTATFENLRSFWTTIEDACNSIIVLKK